MLWDVLVAPSPCGVASRLVPLSLWFGVCLAVQAFGWREGPGAPPSCSELLLPLSSLSPNPRSYSYFIDGDLAVQPQAFPLN